MKITIISSHNLNDNRINKHIRTLLKNNYDITYINYSDSKLEDFKFHNEVKLVHTKMSFTKKNIVKVIFELYKLKKILGKKNMDILHIHDPIFLICFKKAYKKNIITVYDKHEMYETINVFNARVGTKLEKKYIKYTSSTVYVSKQQEKYLISLGLEKIVHVPNYQLRSDFYYTEKKYDNSRISMVYIGDLSSDTRDINLMLQVFKKLLNSSKKIEIILGGTGLDKENEDLVEKLTSKYENFHYKGFLSYDKVIKFTESSDFGFYFTNNHPNNHYSSPNKLFEYLLSGTILVGVGKFVNEENINEKCGLIFDYGTSAKEIAEDIFKLINDNYKMRQFQKKALNLGKEFTWESIENRYIELYNSLNNK